jgi:hypothetical protein
MNTCIIYKWDEWLPIIKISFQKIPLTLQPLVAIASENSFVDLVNYTFVECIPSLESTCNYV